MRLYRVAYCIGTKVDWVHEIGINETDVIALIKRRFPTSLVMSVKSVKIKIERKRSEKGK